MRPLGETAYDETIGIAVGREVNKEAETTSAPPAAGVFANRGTTNWCMRIEHTET